MTLVLMGIVLGLVGAFALTRVMVTLLFGVTPTDTSTIALVSLILIVVAFLACLIPARRATKVDPLVALRYECSLRIRSGKTELQICNRLFRRRSTVKAISFKTRNVI
jgi:hypothetical protein